MIHESLTMSFSEASGKFPKYLGKTVYFAGNSIHRKKFGTVVGYDSNSTHPWIVSLGLQKYINFTTIDLMYNTELFKE